MLRREPASIGPTGSVGAEGLADLDVATMTKERTSFYIVRPVPWQLQLNLCWRKSSTCKSREKPEDVRSKGKRRPKTTSPACHCPFRGSTSGMPSCDLPAVFHFSGARSAAPETEAAAARAAIAQWARAPCQGKPQGQPEQLKGSSGTARLCQHCQVHGTGLL